METERSEGNSASKLKTEIVSIESLHPHPRNYRQHPEDQIDHIVASIREHGLYRNIVVARDGTILAGHGVVLALQRMGETQVPVVRVDVSPNDPRALKLLTGDNEISHLGTIDDRALTEILKQINDEADDNLLGTGFDAMMLANLVMVTRPASEIRDFNAAAEWVGMPAYDEGGDVLKIVVSFASEEARDDFAERLGVQLTEKSKSMWWPPRERRDLLSIRITNRDDEDFDADTVPDLHPI